MAVISRRAWLVGVSAAAIRTGGGDGTLQAYAGDRLVESFGVCTHLESPPYNRNFDAVLRMGAALSLRHIRDEMRPDNDIARWRRLATEAGIQTHLLVSPATNTVADMLEFVETLGSRSVSAIEGQNEGDSPWFKARAVARPTWAEAVVRYQRATFEAIRAHAGMRGISIVSPTVLDYQPDDMRLLRGAAPFCDVIALHAYLQGQQEPETHDDFASIEWYLRNIRNKFNPQAPAMVTETGYATDAAGLSPLAASIYLPRLVLHLFDRGIVRTFLYELMDEGQGSADPEQNYGLLTSDAVPKPAFHALQLLLGALADPGPEFALPPVAVALETAPPDVRLLPFRKRSGEIVLAIWRAARVWDPAARRDLPVEPAPVRLKLPPGFAAATLPLGEGGIWSAVSCRGGGLDIDLSGRVKLIRLSPEAATTCD